MIWRLIILLGSGVYLSREWGLSYCLRSPSQSVDHCWQEGSRRHLGPQTTTTGKQNLYRLRLACVLDNNNNSKQNYYTIHFTIHLSWISLISLESSHFLYRRKKLMLIHLTRFFPFWSGSFLQSSRSPDQMHDSRPGRRHRRHRMRRRRHQGIIQSRIQFILIMINNSINKNLKRNIDFFKIWSLGSYKCVHTFTEEHSRHGIFKNISQVIIGRILFRT
jgi:hypothetical protein